MVKIPSQDSLFDQLYNGEIGVDEVGRGPLAGPVVAVALRFSIPESKISFLDDIQDSKKLTPIKRQILFKKIEAVSDYQVAQCTEGEIDQFNIHNASLLAMARAIELLCPKRNEIIYVDGKYCPKLPYPMKAVIQGDSKVKTIAAASILAKVIRDQIMDDLHTTHPQYSWDKNKAYPTKDHLEAIQKFGVCKFHRQSFAPVRKAIEKGLGKLA